MSCSPGTIGLEWLKAQMTPLEHSTAAASVHTATASVASNSHSNGSDHEENNKGDRSTPESLHRSHLSDYAPIKMEHSLPCSDLAVDTEPAFSSSSAAPTIVYNSLMKFDRKPTEIEVMRLPVESAKIKDELEWHAISGNAEIKPLEATLNVSSKPYPVHIKQELVCCAAAADALRNVTNLDSTEQILPSVAGNGEAPSTQLDSKADLKPVATMLSPAAQSFSNPVPSKENTDCYDAMPLCVKQEYLFSTAEMERLNKSTKPFLAKHIKQECIISSQHEGPLTRLRAKADVKAQLVAASAAVKQEHEMIKLENAVHLSNYDELNYAVDENNDSGIKSESETDFKPYNNTKLSMAHLKRESSADDCVSMKTPTWMVQVACAATQKEVHNARLPISSGKPRSQIKAPHILQTRRVAKKSSVFKLAKNVKNFDQYVLHKRITRSKFAARKLRTRNAPCAAAIIGIPNNSVSIRKSPIFKNKPKSKQKLKRRWKTPPAQLKPKSLAHSYNFQTKLINAPLLHAKTHTKLLLNMQPKVRIKRLNMTNKNATKVSTHSLNLRPLNVKLEATNSCDFYDTDCAAAPRRQTRSAVRVKQETASPIRRRKSATINTVATTTLPKIENAYSLQPIVRLKRLQYNSANATEVTISNEAEIMTETASSLSLSQPKVEQVETEDAVLTAQQHEDSGISLSESPSSSKHSESRAARVSADSSGTANKSALFKDNVLLEIALERAMINALLLQHGHSPVQFQLYNNFDDLKIFLEYLLGKC